MPRGPCGLPPPRGGLPFSRSVRGPSCSQGCSAPGRRRLNRKSAIQKPKSKSQNPKSARHFRGFAAPPATPAHGRTCARPLSGSGRVEGRSRRRPRCRTRDRPPPFHGRLPGPFGPYSVPSTRGRCPPPLKRRRPGHASGSGLTAKTAPTIRVTMPAMENPAGFFDASVTVMPSETGPSSFASQPPRGVLVCLSSAPSVSAASSTAA